jgi:hypothetical protein
MHPAIELIHEELKIKTDHQIMLDSVHGDYIRCPGCLIGGRVIGLSKMTKDEIEHLKCSFCDKTIGEMYAKQN